MPNLFAIEAPLLEKLRILQAESPGIKVGSAITLMGQTNVSAFMPGVFIRPMEPQSAEDVGGSIQEWQRWQVIVAVRAVKDIDNLATTYQALGELAHRVITLLHYSNVGGGLLMYSGRDELYEDPTGHVQMALMFDVQLTFDLADNSTLDDFLRFFPTYDVEDADSVSSDHIDLPGPSTEDTP